MKLIKHTQAVCCLLVDKNGLILGVSRKDLPFGHTDFGLVGGKVEYEETPEEAAARELQEETGLIALSLEPVFMMVDEFDYEVITFLVKEWEGTIHTNENHVVQWLTQSELTSGSFGEYNHLLFHAVSLDDLVKEMNNANLSS